MTPNVHSVTPNGRSVSPNGRSVSPNGRSVSRNGDLYYLNNKLYLFQRVDAVVAIIVYEMQQSIGAYMMYAGIELLAGGNIFIGVKTRAAIESGIVLAYDSSVITIYDKGVIVLKALQDVVE